MKDDIDYRLFDSLRKVDRRMRSRCAHTRRHEEEACDPPLHREIILHLLSEKQGSLRQKELAQAFNVSPSTLSQMLDRLEADGYIERCPDKSDKRATLLTLTESGANREAQIKERYRSRFRQLYRNLSYEEKQTLIALLLKLAAEDDDSAAEQA